MFKTSLACALVAAVSEAQYYGYPQHSGYSPQPYQPYQHYYNPWGQHQQQQEPEKPEGWYSATMEFKPPAIAYMPAYTRETQWARCDFEFDVFDATI